MAVDPALYETDDSTSATAIAFGELASGETSATYTKHLWNGLGNAAADTLTGISLTVYERQVTRDPDTDEVTAVTAWNQSGRATVERWIEARYTNAVGTTNWTPVGKGRWLALDDLAAESKWPIEIRQVVPGGAISSAEREFRIVISWGTFSSAVDLGHHESGKRGVLSGIGDGAYSSLISGYIATANTVPDAGVDFSDGVAVIVGVPYVDIEHEVTFDGNDGDLAALLAGEEYWATVSKGDQSGLTVTKSSKGSSPLANSLRSAVPAGEALVAYVRRDFDAAIATGDIYQDEVFRSRFNLESISGLNATIGPGSALLDNRLITRTGTQIAALTDDATNVVWLDALTGGLYVTESGDPLPAERALRLWQIVMASGSETSRLDLRSYIGPREVEVFKAEIATTLVATTVMGHYYLPPGRDYHLRIPYGVLSTLHDQGSGTTSGSTIFDLEYSTAGGAWTTVFTSQGVAATDRRPTIAYDAVDPSDSTALPEVVTIPGNSRLRWVVDAVPSGGTAPGGATCAAILERG